MAVSKRRHTKSRRGCAQCKRKHIKCDEVAPICGHCNRLGIKCGFQEWNLALSNLQLWTTQAPNQHKDGSLLYSGEDVLLMHHYVLHASFDIAPICSESYHHAWQKSVPALAETRPFLLHSILAVAACHKASLTAASESKALIGAGIGHYIEAMRLFRDFGTELAPENACAVLPFCIMVLLITFFFDQTEYSCAQDPVDRLVCDLAVVRSSVAILDTVIERVLKSDVGILLEHTVNVSDSGKSQGTFEALDLVHDQLNNADISMEEKRAYYTAVEQLRALYNRVGINPGDWAHLLSWAIQLNEHFFTLLQRRQPPALVILAHWCVPLHHAPRRWFFGDWATHTIRAIASELHASPWHPAMAWPLTEAGLG